jgi:hypothetical protein
MKSNGPPLAAFSPDMVQNNSCGPEMRLGVNRIRKWLPLARQELRFAEQSEAECHLAMASP